MNRVILIALAMVCVLLTTDTATAAVYAKEAIDPVVFEGDPDMPSSANPSGGEFVTEYDARSKTDADTVVVSEYRVEKTVRFALWWSAFWGWAWNLR